MRALRHGIEVCAFFVVPVFSAATAHSSFALPYGNSAQAAKTVSASEYLPGQMPGKVVHGVNLFTGQPVYPVSLGSVTVRDKVTWPISLVYQGSSQAVVSRDNATTPTSWVGLGWSLQMPYVAINHNGTKSYHDDHFFCALGPYGGGQLVPSSKEQGRFFLAGNPYVQVFADYGNSTLKDQIVRWVFFFPDGNRMVFGGAEGDASATDSRRTLLAGGSRVGVRSWNIQESENFVYRWDISSFGDIRGRNLLEFSHRYFRQTVALGKSYVREGYPERIFWRDEAGEVVDEVRFSLEAKEESEYPAIAADDDSVAFLQSLYETHALKAMESRIKGDLVQRHEFHYSLPDNGALTHAPKRQLQAITTTTYDAKHPGVEERLRSWEFKYQRMTGSSPGMLVRVNRPDGGADEYEYAQFAPTKDMESEPWRDTEIFSSAALFIPPEQRDDWKRMLNCAENVCYEMSGYRSSDSVRVILNAYSNFGNRFRRSVFNPVGNFLVDRYRNTLDFGYNTSSKTTPHTDVVPVGNDIFVADANFGGLKIYELQSNGDFDSVFAVAPVINGNGKNDTTYEFHAAPGYVIRRRILGNWSALDIYLRNGFGKWEKLDGSTSCGFSNQGGSTDARYGKKIRKENDQNCLSYNDDRIMIRTHANYFVAVHMEYDVMTVYARNPRYVHAGGGISPFVELTDPALDAFPDLSAYGFSKQKRKDGVLYPSNFQEAIENVTLFDDMVVIEAKEDSDDDFFIWLEFDGDRFSPALVEKHDNAHSSDVASFWVFQNYALAYDKQRHEVRAYKRYPGSLRQLKFNGTEWLLNHGSQQHAEISASPQLFSVSIVSNDNGRPALWDNSDTTRYRTYLYQMRLGDTMTIDRTPEIRPYFAKGRVSEMNNVVVFRRYSSSPQDLARCNDNSDCYTIDANFTMDSDAGPENTFLSFSALDGGYAEVGTYVTALMSESRPGRLMAYGAVGGSGHDVDSLRNRCRLRLAQFTGVGYNALPRPWVVSETRTHSGIRSDASNVLRYGFEYNADSAEFSSGTLLPQFRTAKATRCDGRRKDCSAIESAKFVFGMDASFAVAANEFRVQGQVLSETGSNGAGEVRSRVSYAYDAISDTSRWPRAMWLVRLDSARFWAYSKSGSEKQKLVAYSEHDSLTGAALRQDVVFYGAAGLDVSSGSVVENPIAPSQSVRISSKNETRHVLDGMGHTARISAPRSSWMSSWPQQSPPQDSASWLSSAKKVVPDSAWPLIPAEDSVWLAPNPLPDSMQALGVRPQFDSAQGWYAVSRVWPNRFGQDSASAAYRGATSGGEEMFGTVREGSRSLPVAVFAGAQSENVAAFMAENGPVLGFMQPAANGWEFPPGCAFDSSEKKSGLYSLRVDGSDYGPTINLFLRNAASTNFGFVASAWMKSNGSAPILTVERRNASGTMLNSHATRVPVDGEFRPGAWQRYEVRYGNEDLVGNEGLFAGDSSNGYLRIWAGNDEGQGDTVYVDEMVANPDDADFVLYTYEKNGLRKSETDSDHRTSSYEYDIYGRVIGVRDDRWRMFAEKAWHRIGENGTDQ